MLTGISIKRKGKNFVVTLNMFTPPITFVWTNLLPAKSLTQVIEKIIDERRKIGYINQVTTADGNKYIQFGITKAS